MPLYDPFKEERNAAQTAEPVGSASVSLDPERKNGEEPIHEAKNRDYIFQRYKACRQQLETWARTSCTDTTLRERILSCGMDAWVDYSPSTGRYRLRCTRCGFRACPICRQAWALNIRDKITSVLADVAPERRKLCTLTMRSSGCPLLSQVKNLWRSFRKLKQRKVWRENVSGYIAVLEVTYNEARDQWHPHLHLVLDAAFIAQAELSKQWLQVTLNSKIVDIRAVRSFDSISTYLGKYLVKPLQLPPTMAAERVDEYYRLFVGARFTRFGGTLKPNADEELWRPDYPEDWQPAMPLSVLLERLERGEIDATHMAQAIAREKELNARTYDGPTFPP